MPSVHVDKVGEIAIIECSGRFIRTETALKLRDAVTSQTDTHIVVLDLTEMHSIVGGGVGVLVLLQKWAQDHGIRLKLFNPCNPVRNKLQHIDCEIASLEQMMTLLSRVDGEYARALIESQFPLHHLSQYSEAIKPYGKRRLLKLRCSRRSLPMKNPDLTRWLLKVRNALAEQDQAKRNSMLRAAEAFLRQERSVTGAVREEGSPSRSSAMLKKAA